MPFSKHFDSCTAKFLDTVMILKKFFLTESRVRLKLTLAILNSNRVLVWFYTVLFKSVDFKLHVHVYNYLIYYDLFIYILFIALPAQGCNF